MRKMLIMANAVNCDGGIGNCLLNMLPKIRHLYPEYYIDILLLEPESAQNVIMDEKVKIIPITYKFDMREASIALLKQALRGNNTIKRFYLLICRQLHRLNYKIPLINFNAALISNQLDRYDVAVAYNMIPSYITTFVAKYVNAERKIAWAHSDISQEIFSGILKKSASEIQDLCHYRKILKEIDQIVAVSQGVKDSIDREIHGHGVPSCVIQNFTNKNMIIEKSQCPIASIDKKNEIILLTVGRLSKEKGIFLALQTMKILKDQGFNFKWIFVGANHEDEFIQEFLNKHSLQEYMIKTGVQKNPYPYYQICDIYVHTSYIEGYCTTTNEARMLGKPIVTTDVAGATEQVVDGKNGFIVRKNAEDIANAVKLLIKDKELRNRFAEYNSQLPFDNKKETEQLKELFAYE